MTGSARMTADEYAAGIAAMVAHARATGGGRSRCCGRGRCATHLAEQSDATTSTIHLGSSIAVVPNYAHQELVVAFTRAAIDARVGS